MFNYFSFAKDLCRTKEAPPITQAIRDYLDNALQKFSESYPEHYMTIDSQYSDSFDHLMPVPLTATLDEFRKCVDCELLKLGQLPCDQLIARIIKLEEENFQLRLHKPKEKPPKPEPVIPIDLSDDEITRQEKNFLNACFHLDAYWDPTEMAHYNAILKRKGLSEEQAIWINGTLNDMLRQKGYTTNADLLKIAMKAIKVDGIGVTRIGAIVKYLKFWLNEDYAKYARYTR